MTTNRARELDRLADRAFPVLLRVWAVMLAVSYAVAAVRLMAALGGMTP